MLVQSCRQSRQIFHHPCAMWKKRRHCFPCFLFGIHLKLESWKLGHSENDEIVGQRQKWKGIAITLRRFIIATCKTGSGDIRIRLCRLFWLGFFKTMKLLLSVLRKFFVRWRELRLGLSWIQFANFQWWHFGSPREPTRANTDRLAWSELVNVVNNKLSFPAGMTRLSKRCWFTRRVLPCIAHVTPAHSK